MTYILYFAPVLFQNTVMMIKLLFPSQSPHHLRYLSSSPPVARMIDSWIAARLVTVTATRHPELQWRQIERGTGRRERTDPALMLLGDLCSRGWRGSAWGCCSSLRCCSSKVRHA